MTPALLSAFLVLGAADPAPSFETQVAPLLQSHCLKCHNPVKLRGGLDLTTRTGMLKGGEAGAVVVPGKSADSLLYAKVHDGKMPQDGPLAQAEVELLRRWIDAGAPWPDALALKPPAEKGRAGPDWWSLQPIRRPGLPDVKGRDWVRNPIDAFILAGLEAKGLAPAPEADRRTYIRRVTFDLIGLPPTPEEIDAFLKDDAPDAYEKLVDRLLARPEYGERWGRHWLDVVRFAESHGYEMNTLRPNAWPYRDYVIQAFNEDRSYPQFVREQLAGDVVGKGDLLTEAATGFLVGGPHDLVGNAIPEARLQQRMDDMADMVSLTGATFLGLTVGCARCHDHKFDPITQKDFYGLQAVFAGVDHGERRCGPPTPRAAAGRPSRCAATSPGSTHRSTNRNRWRRTPARAAKRPPVQPRRNVERFHPIEARFVRFTIAATVDGTEPCIDELEVYGPDAPADDLALASRGGKASASSVYPNNPFHTIDHLIDGRVGNSRSWISNERGKGWARGGIAEGRDDRPRRLGPRPRAEVRRPPRQRLPRSRSRPTATSGRPWPARGIACRSAQAPPAPTDELANCIDQRKQIEERLASLEKAR